jgi:hypothetical protein
VDELSTLRAEASHYKGLLEHCRCASFAAESAELLASLGKKADEVHRRNNHKAGGPRNLNSMPILDLSAI